MKIICIFFFCLSCLNSKCVNIKNRHFFFLVERFGTQFRSAVHVSSRLLLLRLWSSPCHIFGTARPLKQQKEKKKKKGIRRECFMFCWFVCMYFFFDQLNPLCNAAYYHEVCRWRYDEECVLKGTGHWCWAWCVTGNDCSKWITYIIMRTRIHYDSLLCRHVSWSFNCKPISIL